MSIIFEYRMIDSPLHNLFPLTKLSAWIYIMLMASIWWDIRLLSLLFSFVITCFIVGKVPWKWLRSITPIFMILIFIGIPVIIFMPSTSVTVLPKQIATIEFYFISIADIYWLSAYFLKTASLILAGATFFYTTSPTKLVNALRERHAPAILCNTVLIFCRILPLLSAKISQLREAQKLRGAKTNTKNPKKIIELSRPLIRPVFYYLVNLDNTLSIALTTRGFGKTKTFTNWRTEMNWTLQERLITGFFGTFTIIAIILRISIGLGSL